MAKRYIGDAVVTIAFRQRAGHRDDYVGTISVPKERGSKGRYVWKFEDLHAPAVGFSSGISYDSPKAYDGMAGSAVTFGGYYTTNNRGDDVPDWAPKPEVADAINEAVSTDDQGDPEVRRSPKGKVYSTSGNPRKGHKAKRATPKGKKANPKTRATGSHSRGGLLRRRLAQAMRAGEHGQWSLVAQVRASDGTTRDFSDARRALEFLDAHGGGKIIVEGDVIVTRKPKTVANRRRARKTTRKGATGRLYTGPRVDTGLWEVFRSSETPTEKSHGRIYKFVTGPMRTVGEAYSYITAMGGADPNWNAAPKTAAEANATIRRIKALRVNRRVRKTSRHGR